MTSTTTPSSASLWLELQYFASAGCDIPVDAAYLFSVANQFSFIQPANETWGDFYLLVIDEIPALPYPNNLCGSAQQPFWSANQQCCIESLDPSFINSGSMGMGSGTAVLLPSSLEFNQDSSTLFPYFTISSSQISYCQLGALSPVSTLVFGGFQTFLLRQDPTLCVNIKILQGSATCLTNGSLIIYPSFYCQGPPVTVINLTTTFLPTSIQNVSGSIQTIKAPSQTVGWIATIPQGNQVPLFHNPFETISLVVSILALSASTMNLIYSSKLFLDSKFKNGKYLALVVIHFMWLLATISGILYTFVIFATYFEAGFLTGFKYYSAAFASLITALFSIKAFSALGNLTPRTLLAIEILTSIIWLGCEFGAFLFPILISFQNPTPDLYILSWIWLSQATQYWKFLFFVINLVPTNLIAFKICNNLAGGDESLTFLEVLETLTLLDPYFFKIDLCQLLLIIVYFTFTSIAGFTNIYGNDRTRLSCESILDLLINLHAMLSLWSLSRLQTILKGQKTNPNIVKLRRSTARRKVVVGSDDKKDVKKEVKDPPPPPDDMPTVISSTVKEVGRE